MDLSNKDTEFSIIQPKKTAVLVDLSFFIEGYNTRKSIKTMEAAELAKRLKDYVWETLRRSEDYLYKVYIYDCEPLDKNVPMPPIEKTDKSKNLSKTTTYKFRSELLKHLRKQPYFAVRLGEIDVSELSNEDFVIDIKQKGVDMKVGLDIATLANKHQVEKIILITSDSDFVPAVKHARKEGLIVQLDTMRFPETRIKKGLLEHIDILSSVFINKNKNGN
nr:NYN domain-containing protein [Campylobacter jejuni]